MITIKSEREIELLREAGRLTYLTHKEVEKYIKPGITTKELDKIAEKFILSKGCTPSFKIIMVFLHQYVHQLMMR